MEAAKRLMKKVSAGRLTTGVLATDQLWPQMIEFLRLARIDYLIADQEHGVHGDALVAEVCALGRQVDFPVLIRPVDTQASTIRRAIDRGPCGLLLPTVDAAAQLDVVRDCIWMPPRGRRRPGGPGNYWVSDFSHATWKSEVEDDFIILPQIESRVGLQNLESIARHEITSAMAIGPYDLSMDLGVGGQMDHPELMAATEKIRQAAAAAGKAMWRIGHGPTMASEDYHFLCIGEPMAMLKAAFAQQQQETQAVAGVPSE